MNLLAIDTSTEHATVALVVNGCMHTVEESQLRQHAPLLLPMIERLLIETDVSLSQLDGIVFGRGPGSFTGLRVACSVAKGLAYAVDLPLFPVSSLAAIAAEVYRMEGAAMPDARVLVMMDARMQEVYWGYGDKDPSTMLEYVTPAMDIHVSTVSPLIVAGVGFEPYLHALPHLVQEALVKQCTVFPSAEAMIRLVHAGHVKAISAAEAMPYYVRNQVTQGETRG